MSRVIQPAKLHHMLKGDIDALLLKHTQQLPAEEVLAIGAQIVGMLIAFQDRDTMTHERAMGIVIINIEAGNAMAVKAHGEPESFAS